MTVVQRIRGDADSRQANGELHHTPGDQASLLAISGLHDIEEDIWSPKWGLKGKVDASVQVSVNKDPARPGSEVEDNVAPLEIKTGRAIGVMAHRAQTMLYTLLMEDRYGMSLPNYNDITPMCAHLLTFYRGTCSSWITILL